MKQIPVSSQNRKYLCTCERPGRYGIALFFFFFFLHRNVHFLYDNKTATSNSRRNSSLKFVENECPAMERFSLSLTSMQATE